MQIDENEYFRNATMKIFGNLNVEEAMLDCIRYLREFIPADRMFLHLLNYTRRTVSVIVAVSHEKILPPETITYLPNDLIESILAKNEADKETGVYCIYDNNMDLAEEFRKNKLLWENGCDNSLLQMSLWMNDEEDAVVNIHADGLDRYNEHHVHLLKLLREPLKKAMQNILKYQKIKKSEAELLDKNRYLNEELLAYTPTEIVGKDRGLKEIMKQVHQVALIDSPVLLLGETGVGKEVISNAIHYLSLRNNGPFIKVNSGAIPENLMDSELFGHEKGAFTGSLAIRIGRFERAHKGTIFLDEIGELTPPAQIRLLRVLEHKVIERVGGSKFILVDVRIISATHRNLQEMVRSGQFREDLLYRLNVFPITIPPLRQRKEDILALTQHFIQKKSIELRMDNKPLLHPESIDRLKSYHWPGNVRELENTVERALIQSRVSGGTNLLDFNDLISSGQDYEEAPVLKQGEDLLSLDEVIISHVRRALLLTKGRIYGPGGAADRLKIHPNTLRSRMKKLDIPFDFGKEK